MVSEAKSNCLHSSNHPSLFISPFSPCLLIHQAIIISLSLQSHPSLSSLNHSSPPPAYTLSVSFPTMIPSAFLASVCLFLRGLSLLNTVVSRLLSPRVFFCCELLCPCFKVTQLASCHNGYCWREQEWKTSACMKYVHAHTWSLQPGLLV